MIIVFEGIDSSGKETQSKLLYARLKKEGYNVEFIGFPRYDTETGKLIKKLLKKGFINVSPEVAILLYALDKYVEMSKNRVSDILIIDRYTPSNIVYWSAITRDKKITSWIKQVESRLPKPDIIIFMDTPPEIARELNQNKKDKFEEWFELQKKVYKKYKKLAEKEGWIIIKTVKKGQIRKIDEIHEEIYKKIKKFLRKQQDKI